MLPLKLRVFAAPSAAQFFMSKIWLLWVSAAI
jgi:hypothetical protein